MHAAPTSSRRAEPRRRAAARAPVVVGTATALPSHRYDQRELARAAARLFPQLERREGFLERFFSRVGVEQRYLALEPDQYAALNGFEDRSRVWMEVALELGERCLSRLFDEAGVAPDALDQLTTTTVTGVAVPSLDARLMNRLPLSPRLRRVPLFGLGCLGGAAGLARASEYLRAFPDQLAALLSVELCSLTIQHDDVSVANVISSGLFGDGAAAVLLAGAEHPLATESGAGVGPLVLASRSAFFEDTERVMGWDMVDEGFKIVLDPSVPDVVRAGVPPVVDSFLSEQRLLRSDIEAWVSHPGGPAVMRALAEGLHLPGDALAPSREMLARVGNLSSASVLFLLDDLRRNRRPRPGAAALMLAMGPAFCAELVLLRC